MGVNETIGGIQRTLIVIPIQEEHSPGLVMDREAEERSRVGSLPNAARGVGVMDDKFNSIRGLLDGS